MIKIYISDTDALSGCGAFEYYKNRIDDARKEKLDMYRNEEDKRRSLLAGYLIQVGVREQIGKESGLHHAIPLSLSYTYGENGKPYLREYPEVFFSLSHSGRYVVAAFADEEIGIDIQYHKPMKNNIAERFFSEEDNQLLAQLQQDGDADAFFRMWALKEAYMKLTGEGMKQGLNQTVIENEENGRSEENGIRKCRLQSGIIRGVKEESQAFFQINDKIEKYSIAVCCRANLSDIVYSEVNL